MNVRDSLEEFPVIWDIAGFLVTLSLINLCVRSPKLNAITSCLGILVIFQKFNSFKLSELKSSLLGEEKQNITIYDFSSQCKLVGKSLFDTVASSQLATQVCSNDGIMRWRSKDIQDGFPLLLRHLENLISQKPELSAKLLRFLDDTRVSISLQPGFDADGHSQRRFVATLSPRYAAHRFLVFNPHSHNDKNGHSNFDTVLFYNNNEVVLLQPPQDKSENAVNSYHAVRSVYELAANMEIANAIVNNKCLRAFENPDSTIVSMPQSSSLCQINERTKDHRIIVHTLKKSYFGNWYYAGAAEKNSYREIFQRTFY